MNVDQFIGQTSFCWFTGVVEDIADPAEMGRIRVRCFGYHTADKTDIPTSALPWATPILPVTSASMSGIGVSATGILPGSWVIGFFRDGASAQDPIILGTIPSRSSPANSRLGFSDPSGANPRNPGDVDTPKPAKSDYFAHRAYTHKADLRVEKVETAVPPKLTTNSIPEPDSYYTRRTWDSPKVESYTKPIYTKNHVHETEGGHVTEIDDTTGFARLAQMHSSGTHRVITNDGTEILTIVGSRYTVVMKEDNVLIRGSCSLTIDGSCRKLVKGNYFLEVEGNYTEYVKGSVQRKIGLSEQTEIGQDRAVNITNRDILHVGGDSSITVKGNAEQTYVANNSITTTGNLIDLTMSDRKTVTAGKSTIATTGATTLSYSTLAQYVSGASTITSPGTFSISGSNVSINGSNSITIESGSGGTSITSDGTISAVDSNPSDNSIVT